MLWVCTLNLGCSVAPVSYWYCLLWLLLSAVCLACSVIISTPTWGKHFHSHNVERETEAQQCTERYCPGSPSRPSGIWSGAHSVVLPSMLFLDRFQLWAPLLVCADREKIKYIICNCTEIIMGFCASYLKQRLQLTIRNLITISWIH